MVSRHAKTTGEKGEKIAQTRITCTEARSDFCKHQKMRFTVPKGKNRNYPGNSPEVYPNLKISGSSLMYYKLSYQTALVGINGMNTANCKEGSKADYTCFEDKDKDDEQYEEILRNRGIVC